MARDRDRNDRQDRRSRDEDEVQSELPETRLRASALLDELLRYNTPKDDDLHYRLLLLRHQIEVDEKQFEEAQKLIQEYDEAYTKLTSPANRLATFLDQPDREIAHIALGDTEYIANIDPKWAETAEDLRPGTRVKVNEAFNIVGDVGPHPTGPIVKIAEVLEGNRLRVSMDSQGMNSRVVGLADHLECVPLKNGDEVRLDPAFRIALEHFAHKETQDYYLEDVPEIPWSAVGGQEEAIAVIRDAIELPLLYPELFARFEKQPLKGILLYGPPGCGKTLIGKATAHNLTQEYRERTQRDVKEYFMFISGPKILNMWLGESERMVREIFSTAREKAREGHLVFIFIDEAESLLRTRNSGRWTNISNTLVPQFAAEMDGMVKLENVIVMLNSNRPDYIDPAILRPERIDRKVKVTRPDRRASRDILAIYLNERTPIDPALAQEKGDLGAAREFLIDEATERIFRKSDETRFLQVNLRNGSVDTLYWKDLVSGAMLKSIVERAKDLAIKRGIEEKNFEGGLTLQDIETAIATEYRENEIFPKTDGVEDWLKLLDYELENVVNIRPIRPGVDTSRRNQVI
jgi:proteasome-associated ATPase